MTLVAAVLERGRQVQIGHALLAALVALVFGVGWLAGRGVRLAWLGLTGALAALELGWRAGRSSPG